jgi:hypothetical protein
MAGMSGNNLKISKSRLGCRLPFEQSGSIGNGYAVSGKVREYKLSPEEVVRRYGPVNPRREGSPYHARIIQAIKASHTPEEAADLLNVTAVNLKRHLWKMGINPQWNKEAEDVETAVEQSTTAELVQMAERMIDQTLGPIAEPAEAPETGLKDAASGKTPEPVKPEKPKTKLELALELLPKETYLELKAQNLTDREICKRHGLDEKNFWRLKEVWGIRGVVFNKPKTRIEIAREKLSKEKYLELKNQGLTDLNIKSEYSIATDIMTVLKYEWGIIGVAKDEPPQSERQPEPSPEPKGLTISQALQLRTETEEDLESLNRILEVAAGGAELTERVVKLLGRYRDDYRQTVERIDGALNRVVVEL